MTNVLQACSTGVAALDPNCLAALGSGRSIRDCDATEGTRRAIWAEICHTREIVPRVKVRIAMMKMQSSPTLTGKGEAEQKEAPEPRWPALIASLAAGGLYMALPPALTF